jgi:hypothetical protein
MLGLDALMMCLGVVRQGFVNLVKRWDVEEFGFFDEKFQFFRHPIFLPSLQTPAQLFTNASSTRLVPTFEDKFFLNIIGNE